MEKGSVIMKRNELAGIVVSRLSGVSSSRFPNPRFAPEAKRARAVRSGPFSPDILDVSYKLFRKCLPSNFDSLVHGWAGSRKTHFAPGPQMRALNRYLSAGPLTGKRVLEIGPGNEVATAVLMILEGAKEVYLVDEVNEFNSRHGRFFDRPGYIEHIRKISPKDEESEISSLEISSRIHIVPSYFCSDILGRFDGLKVDCIFSNNVLEHMRNLNDAFRTMRVLIKPGGTIFHRVDLSDHNYHVFNGSASLKTFRENNELSYLRYSDKMFRMLNDAKSIPMNRALLPKYIELCSKYGFALSNISITEAEHRYDVHSDILRRMNNDFRNDRFLQIKSFKLTARRGP
jgi:SAM-dependent methyltransferase